MHRGDESEKFQLMTEDRSCDCEDPVWIFQNSIGANESATGSPLLVMPGATAKGSKAAGLDFCRIIYCLDFI